MVEIRELVEMICCELGASFEKAVEVVPARRGQDAAYRLDCTHARKELDWMPTISLEQSITETVEWAKRNLDALRSQPRHYVHKP